MRSESHSECVTLGPLGHCNSIRNSDGLIIAHTNSLLPPQSWKYNVCVMLLDLHRRGCEPENQYAFDQAAAISAMEGLVITAYKYTMPPPCFSPAALFCLASLLQIHSPAPLLPLLYYAGAKN